MGMGYAANQTFRLKDELIERIAAGEMTRLKLLLNAANLSMWNLADYMEENMAFEEDDNKTLEVAVKIYREVIDKVLAETGVHVCLSVHNSASNGDRYDDVNGAFWECTHHDELFTPTPAAQKLGSDLLPTLFVSYG